MTIHRTFAARRGLFVALVLLAPGAVRAQSDGAAVAGRVTSAGQPLPGATVVLVGTGRGTLARADGAYRLAAPVGRYEIRVRMLGYATIRDSVTVSAGATTTKNFELQKSVAALEAVTTLGTRGEARSVIDAPVPIDILSAADIKATGRTETAQMIQSIAPSFNFPRTSIGDGTDHVRPATLRGLAPDQSLVLLNGKRRHNSALVNVNGFVGRGSAPVDLNAIPASMIDHIEILRDGAAAQYGSDAIAGVINIVLKKDAGGDVSSTVGENKTTFNRGDGGPLYAQQVGTYKATDGHVFQGALDYGWSRSQTSFLHVGGEVRDRGYTNRSILDPRVQYSATDARETNPLLPQPGRIDHRQGDSQTHDLTGFWNGGASLGAVEFYTFGGVGKRNGEASGFFRRPLDDRTLRNIYPDGFLPIIRSNIVDASGSAGFKGQVAGFDWDLGGVYGGNDFGFTIKNSANVSLGPTSKTQFDAGHLKFAQGTGTLDLSRSWKDALPVPLTVALGGEVRNDRYEIVAGEPDSWRNGGFKVIDVNGVTTTRPAAPGSQVFPGFKGDSAGRPGDAGVHTRNNTAGYIDVSSDITSKLLVDVAGRAEHYSDFGGTTTGKVSSRYQIVPGVAVRGAYSTGFRAPSLMQEYFSSTATNFVGGIPFDIKTFPASSSAAIALGSSALKPEKSHNSSLGFALEPVSGLSITADYYYIGISDRIVLSDNFIGDSVAVALGKIGITGVQGGRYFTNAIDTKTEGVDIISNLGFTLDNSAVVRLTAAYNHNGTRVTRVSEPLPNLKQLSEALFGRVERGRIEQGNPKDNLILSGTYTQSRVSLNTRAQRYGEVTQKGSTANNAFGPLDQTFNPKWITDLSVGYNFGRLAATVGSDNIFDVYPDRNNNPGSIGANNGGNANFGIFPYNGISPFGFNGRFIYARLTAGI